MLTFDTKYQEVLAALIAERITGISEEIAMGQMPNFEQYKHDAGRIRGLKEALEFMDEANRKLQER